MGYYFGRLPAEKRAEKAEEQVATAQDNALKELTEKQEKALALKDSQNRYASLESKYVDDLKNDQQLRRK